MYRVCKLHVAAMKRQKHTILKNVHALHMLFPYNLHAFIQGACIYACIYSNTPIETTHKACNIAI